jgi:hypothetical protein
MKKNDIWISRFNDKLYATYNETELVKLMTAGSLVWLCADVAARLCRKLTFHKPINLLAPEFYI